MNLGFMEGGTAAHEFGHAIGLAHEHQNPKIGIEWNEAKVFSELSRPPNNWDAETIRHNVLNKYKVDQIKGAEFDPHSIMLYFFPDTWVKSGVGTKANSVLSALDQSFIAGAEAYPKTAPPLTLAVLLKVNATKRTSAAIDKPAEEDLYQFAVKTGGTYVIDTLGPTDLVMKLYGPNSPTAFIAEDDDSGVNTNARIQARLIPGNYFVQIRHHNLASGIGPYSIKVARGAT